METVLQTYGLTKQYGSFTALSNLDLALERGKIIGLLGPNGSGKTTFIKLCCGLIKPTAGDILICGMPIGVETKKVVYGGKTAYHRTGGRRFFQAGL